MTSKHANMKNAPHKLTELTGFAQAVKDYAADGGANDFDAFYDEKSASLPGLRKNASFERAFAAAYDRAVNSGSSSGGHASAPATPPSAGLDALMSQTGDMDVTPAKKVIEKYSKMTRKLDRVLLGKSEKRYFILMGGPGLGKTYTVIQECTRLGLDLPTYTGDIGANITAVVAFLYEHRDDDTFILDDCDSMVKTSAPAAVSNTLKGAMGTPKHEVTMSITINQRVNRFMQETTDHSKDVMSMLNELHSVKAKADASKLTEGNDSISALREAASDANAKLDNILENAFWIKKCANSVLVERKLTKLLKRNCIEPTDEIMEELNHMFDGLNESAPATQLDNQIKDMNEAQLDEAPKETVNDDDEEIEDDGADASAEGDGELDTDGAKVPTTFVFNARMIIVSNCSPQNINSALLSRADYFDMSLTNEEYLVRLASVIDNIKSQVEPKLQKKVKALIMSTLPLLIEAHDKGKTIGGQKVEFTHPLEFRMINSLLDDYEGRMEDLTSSGLSFDEAFKKAYPSWVVYDFVPLL